MSVEKDKESLEKLFLKSNEKNIFAKIQERHNIKFFLGNLLNEEIYLKNGILEVLNLAVKYNKIYVFNETWKKIAHLTSPTYQLEIYREIIKKVLIECTTESEILKIVCNKVPFSLAEIGMEAIYPAFKQLKTANLIFFFEKRRLKKQKDLTESCNDIVSAAHAFNDDDLLNYLEKRKVNVFGNNLEHLKKAAISGKIEKLNYFYGLNNSSFKKMIDWSKEDIQPHEQSEKWLKSLELKEKLSIKLKPKTTKIKVEKI